MERDLFRIIKAPEPLVLNGTNLRPECHQCLRRWIDDVSIGIVRPLPCNLNMKQVLAYIDEFILPPPSCAYPLIAVYAMV